ncbi:diguanylate cyclase domain-containing protein [Campylobacter majalis]|uniref:sensor domain-containing diguanylate cyclase n=1 Tax=Campylobacter majalis TaxID=2790656 RepID=UPI003D692022
MQNLNKNLDILTLCINKDDFYTLNLDDIHDIWPSEPNKNDIKFYFKKLIKTIEFNNRFFEQKEIFETIINSTDDLIWVKDTIGRHKLFNNSFLDALPSAPDGHRKTREECTNRGHLFIWELSPEDYEQGEFICMESEIDVMRADATLTLNETLKVGSGELRSLITKKAPIHDRNGKIMGTIGVAKDVTQELLYKKQLKKIAYTDMLTGLYNRRYIYDWMDRNSHKNFGILFMDLNDFKYVNDKYGHVVGDEALMATANTLKDQLKGYILGRFGGDEFIAIRDKCDVDLQKEADKLVKILEKTYATNQNYTKLGISVGYAINNPKDPDIEGIIHKADTHMYKHKTQSKMA